MLALVVAGSPNMQGVAINGCKVIKPSVTKNPQVVQQFQWPHTLT
jgi:hypothetical protein